MFSEIKAKVQECFGKIQETNLFNVNLEKYALFDAYLQAMPEAIRQEHNCNCCRSFLNQYGGLVAVKNGTVLTLWDFEISGEYAAVPSALRKLVLDAVSSAEPFVSKFEKLGTDSNVQLLDSGDTIRWEHFFVELPKAKKHRGSESVESVVGRIRSAAQVFERSLKELTLDATDTVLELIAQNSLYRGAEFKRLLEQFRAHQAAVKDKDVALYVMEHIAAPIAIRNTAIGTLLVDLSEGRELDAAVTAFERMVAPTNYKRPTALVTPKMIENAEKELSDLGLLDSIPRRHATMDDIPVGEMLFVNRPSTLSGSVFDALKEDVPSDPKSFSKVEIVPFDTFVSSVLPTATSVEVLFENKHAGNLVNLTAGNEGAAPVFNWASDVAWVYKDGVADSVKERVKQAGGRVDGVLRISLEWYNTDDLDLHVTEPSGRKIYYGAKKSATGALDVDMNIGGDRRDAVENVIYPVKADNGTYKIEVNNFTRRENIDTGFSIEVECQGEVHTFSSSVSPRNKDTIEVATVRYDAGKGITVLSGVGGSSVKSREINGLKTNRFYKVNAVVPSPNYWDGRAMGNKHTFFLLSEARTDEKIRGFFNEFLRSDLQAHRKVFELLGEKTKINPDGYQLAGLGFSSTQPAEIICRVTGAFTRTIKVQF